MTEIDPDEQRKDNLIEYHMQNFLEKEAAKEAEDIISKAHAVGDIPTLVSLNKMEVQKMEDTIRDRGPMGRLIIEMENLCIQGADLSSKASRVNKKIIGDSAPTALKDGDPIPGDAKEPSFTEEMQDLMNTMQVHIASIKHDLERLEDSL